MPVTNGLNLPHHRVVIVGAGLAGLAAAWRLTQASETDFIILEADPRRVGGRVESIHVDDNHRLDMGAQWLHGEKENPIYEWLRDLDCIAGPDEEEVEFEGLFCTQDGVEAPKAVVSRVLEILLDAKTQLYKLSPSLDYKTFKPIEVLRQSVAKEVARCPVLKSADPKVIKATQKWFELYEMIDNSCESLDLLSIRAYSEWTDFDNGQMVKLKGGWQRVANKMIEFIGACKVHLGSKVLGVDYTSDNLIEIPFLTGEGKTSRLTCSHVILTVSLGVLQSGSISLEPPLGEKAERAIKSCGFGPAEKIFLKFEVPILQEERGVKLLWLSNDQTDIMGPSQNVIDVEALPNWARSITGFDLVDGAPNYLLAWVGGQGVNQMKNLTDEEVQVVCAMILEKFLPISKRTPNPRLISVTRSRWSANDNIRGSYSYQSVASDGTDTRTLWQPILSSSSNTNKPRLLFAGEHTAGNMHATAHGAIISGWREAERLIKFYAHRTSSGLGD